MKNTKLISMLRTFSNEEMKSFGKFINSPYFISGRNLKPLFAILKKFHPEFKSPQLTEESIFSKLNPKEKYDKKKSAVYLRVLFSDMTKLARKFLGYEGYVSYSSGIEFRNYLAGSLQKRSLMDESLKILKENSLLLDTLDKTPRYYLDRLKLDGQISSCLLDMHKEKATAESEKNSLLYLYSFMFMQVALFLHNGFTRKYNYNIEFRGFEMVKSFLNGFDPLLFDKECSDDGLETKNNILFNYYILKSRINENDKQSLLNAIETYKKMFHNISRKMKFSCFVSLNNRLEGRRHLDRIYLIKANELYDFVSESNSDNVVWGSYAQQSIYHSILHFKAALLTAKKLKEFIDENVEKTPVEYRESLRNYSCAFYYFKKGSYDKCLELIAKNDILDNSFKVDKYKLKICSFFQLNLFEDTIYALDSFEHFIRRRENVGAQIRKYSLEFIQAMKNIVQFKLDNGNNIDLCKLKMVNRNTLFGDWITEKADELTVSK